MPIAVECPACGAKLRAADSMAGKNLKCLKCAAVVPVPVSSASTAIPMAKRGTADAPKPTPQRRPVAPPVTPRREGATDEPRRQREVNELPRDRRDYEPDVAGAPRRGLPVWVWIVGAIGVALAGVVGIALVIYLAMPTPTRPREERQGDAPIAGKGSGDTITADPIAQKGSVVQTVRQRVNAPGEEWEAGPAGVRIVSAKVYDEDLQILLVVRVADPKDKVTFQSWRDPLLGRTKVRLADNNGTVYAAPGYDLAADGILAANIRNGLAGKMGFGSGAVYADQPRADMLLFEKPTPAAEYLDLDLDASHLGQHGTIMFRIPREMWAPAPKTKAESASPMPPTKTGPAQPKTPRRPGEK